VLQFMIWLIGSTGLDRLVLGLAQKDTYEIPDYPELN
jgi:hypothetical protein